jgi:type VI secretion system protein ImpF
VANLQPRERLQPALLERLTDDARLQVDEHAEQRVVSPRQLRDAVIRDLGWLFNTVYLGSVIDLAPYPEVANSVLNYGVTSLSGRHRSGLTVSALERALHEAIRRFEPRILPESLKVQAQINWVGMVAHAVHFEISGLLWQHPMPEAFQLLTELDLDTGHTRVKSVSRS